jgi:hypothetical protein
MLHVYVTITQNRQEKLYIEDEIHKMQHAGKFDCTDMFDLLHNHLMVDLDMCFFEYE